MSNENCLLQEEEVAILTERIEAKRTQANKKRFTFRLMGRPPEKAIKRLEIDSDSSIFDVKAVIRKAYGLHFLFDIQFIHDGMIVPSDTTLSRAGIDPQEDCIIVMVLLSGG